MHASRLQPIEQVLAQWGKSERGTEQPGGHPEKTNLLFAQTSTTEVETRSEPAQASDLAQRLHDALVQAGMTFSADAVQHSEVSLEGGDLLIRAPKTMMLALKDPGVQRIAGQVLAKPVRVRIVAGENVAAASVPAASADQTKNDVALRDRALSHPGVKRFQELFPGAQVRSVRNLNE